MVDKGNENAQKQEVKKVSYKEKFVSLSEQFTTLMKQYEMSEQIRRDQALMIENLKAQIVQYKNQDLQKGVLSKREQPASSKRAETTRKSREAQKKVLKVN